MLASIQLKQSLIQLEALEYFIEKYIVWHVPHVHSCFFSRGSTVVIHVHIFADIVEVVVLASCTDALLGVDGRLELVESRVGISRS